MLQCLWLVVLDRSQVLKLVLLLERRGQVSLRGELADVGGRQVLLVTARAVRRGRRCCGLRGRVPTSAVGRGVAVTTSGPETRFNGLLNSVSKFGASDPMIMRPDAFN